LDKLQLVAIINEWQNLIPDVSGVHRSYVDELFNEIGSKPIKIVTGFRRSGKSFLVQQVAKECIRAQKIRKDNILYLNFEDFRLSDISGTQELSELVTVFETHIAKSGRQLIIFDEIQNVAGWDKLVRTLYEKKRETDFILTGSNSSLLSSEIGSNLAGRFIEFFILPFDFREYLTYRNVSITTEIDLFKNIHEIEKHFSDYLQFGGLPETFDISSPKAKYSYLEGIVSKIILDDIVRRYGVRQVAILENVLHYLMVGNGNIVSHSRISNLIKSGGVTLKDDTVGTYIDYLVKSFSLFSLEKFDWKAGKVFGVSKKYYATDTGLVNLYDSVTNQYSRHLENIVFLHLKRMDGTLFFGALPNGKEIDFIVKNRDRTFDKYQVCQSINEENRKRELGNFLLTDAHLSCGRNILLTMDAGDDTVLNYEESVIEKKFLIKWLLFS